MMTIIDKNSLSLTNATFSQIGRPPENKTHLYLSLDGAEYNFDIMINCCLMELPLRWVRITDRSEYSVLLHANN